MRKISILAILLFGMVISCQKENNQIPQDQNAVSLNEAVKVATNIAGSDVVKSIFKNGSQARRGANIIEEIVAVPDQQNPSYYIVNYAGGGWTIIAGDKRINPVLGYSDDSKFQTSGKVHFGLLQWLSEMHQNVAKIKSSKGTSPSTPTAQMWNQLGIMLPPSDGGDGGDGGSSGGGGCVPSSSTVSVGPLVSTHWSQECAYNGSCPSDPNGPCGHDLTGCVATAMSQVLNYWKMPARYNWTAMQPFSANIYGLMSDAGVSVGMQYGAQSSGAQGSAIAPALKNTFGYSSATYENFNFSVLAGDLYYRKEPLILTAFANQQVDKSCFLFWCSSSTTYYNGHCWVADGYQITNATVCTNGIGSTTQSNMIHMNWGWDGACDGWYNATSWTPTGTNYNFRYVQQMVHGIHP